MQMEDVLQHFLWDWSAFNEQYRVHAQSYQSATV